LLRIIIIIALLLGAAELSAATHEYTVTLSDDLKSLEVEARLAGGVSRVSARASDARKILVAMRDCETDEKLHVDSRSVAVRPGLRCLVYSVDLGNALRQGQHAQWAASATVVVPITRWMWRPRLGGSDEILVSFRLPDGVDVSVPWQPLDAEERRFRLTSSPQSGTGLAVFGEFESATVTVAGAELRIVSLPSQSNPIQEHTIDWTRQTAANVGLAYGRFPNPNARVILFPAANPRSNSAVPFGRVVRDGGETVELLVNPHQPEEVFLGDWTATHEFSHLMLPYLDRRQRWISEGFAQYYQNVLLARAGRYTQEHAWQKIRDGLERGRDSVPTLSPNQAAAGGERNSRMKIYWSGAALALMADVELRRRSGGAESLDLVLDRLQACCLPSKRTWTGRDLFEQFDALLDEPLFVELYERYAERRGLPDFEAALEQPELAEIRAAITARRYTGEPDG
jgi:hypothetical protein